MCRNYYCLQNKLNMYVFSEIQKCIRKSQIQFILRTMIYKRFLSDQEVLSLNPLTRCGERSTQKMYCCIFLNEDHFAGSNNTELFSKVVLNDMLNSANYEKMMDDSDSHVASNVARLKSEIYVGELAAATQLRTEPPRN